MFWRGCEKVVTIMCGGGPRNLLSTRRTSGSRVNISTNWRRNKRKTQVPTPLSNDRRICIIERVDHALIYVKSRKKLRKAGTKTPGPDLARDLQELVGDCGEVSDVSQGASGGVWCYVYLWGSPYNEHLTSEALDGWLEKLCGFLATWGMPVDTRLEGFLVVGPHKRSVFPRQARKTSHS